MTGTLRTTLITSWNSGIFRIQFSLSSASCLSFIQRSLSCSSTEIARRIATTFSRLATTLCCHRGTAIATHIAKTLKTACIRSEEHTSELQSQSNLVCRLLLEKKKKTYIIVQQ